MIATVIPAPITREPATERFKSFISPVPKLLAATMLKPFPIPRENPTKSSYTAELAPIAASASSPRKFPTIIVSCGVVKLLEDSRNQKRYHKKYQCFRYTPLQQICLRFHFSFLQTCNFFQGIFIMTRILVLSTPVFVLNFTVNLLFSLNILRLNYRIKVFEYSFANMLLYFPSLLQ